ncbi:MAG: response regulator [Anaerolineae bacterium]|nr:response regulator [Anaerolineae bacterium]
MVTALFIDNDQASLVLFEELCRYMGVQYVGMQNPTHIDSIRDTLNEFDIIFLDLEMPTVTGYTMLKILRAYPLKKGCPIIACTVYNTERDNARLAGFDSFIIKPLNVDRFPKQLENLLAGQQIWEMY